MAICELLFLAVPRKPQHFHAIQKRGRDDVERIGGGDEKHFRQIERHVEIVVAKGRILSRIEDLQERRRRVAAVVATKLVNLVEHQDRIVDAGAADRLDNSSGHGADVGTPVTSQLRLVMRPPKLMRSNLRSSERAID